MSNAEPMKKEETPMGKIGFGPEGRPAGLIQFIVLTAVLTIIFVYAVSPASIPMTILPATLIMLIALGQLVLAGDCFPCAPPGGNWNPTIGRAGVGIKMTVLWAIYTIVFLVIMLYAFPKWPMSPLYLWWGALGFGTTLLYNINWNGWPFKGKVHPWVMMIIATIVAIVVACIVWQFTNLGGTPLAGSPFDKQGPLNVNLLTGFVVWFIAWFFVFSPVFVTQGWPFAKFGHPGAAIAQTILSFILGYICWMGSLKMGISPTFSFGAVASSIIFWSLVYCWHLQFWGITRLTGAARAISAIIAVFVLTAIWIGICNVILGPAAATMASLKLPADINILIIYLNLCIVGPALIAHNAFWLRWPLTLPNPPGTPPPDVSAP